MLLFLQCSASSFYDPARRALIPTIVTARDLPLATTLDSYAWSLVGALGASLGGFAVRRKPPFPALWAPPPLHPMIGSSQFLIIFRSFTGSSQVEYVCNNTLWVDCAARCPSWERAHASCWMR